jgi:RimJ/RimL family protein N-acetyltransferase
MPDGGRADVATSPLLTARLRLAPVTAADEAELFALHSDPRAFREDSTEPLTDPAQMRWVLAQWRASWAEHGMGHLTVRARKRADLPVGLLGVVGLVPLRAEPEPDHEPDHEPVLSAYWRLRPDVTGHGIASEAMRAVLGALPDPVAAHGSSTARSTSRPRDAAPHRGMSAPREVVAITAGTNFPSLALADRLGFRPAPPQRPVPGGRPGDVLLVLPAAGESPQP